MNHSGPDRFLILGLRNANWFRTSKAVRNAIRGGPPLPRKKSVDFETVKRNAVALIDAHVWPGRRLVMKQTGGGSETVGEFLRQINPRRLWEMRWGHEPPPRTRPSPSRTKKSSTSFDGGEIAELRVEIAELKRHILALHAELSRQAQQHTQPSEDRPSIPSAPLPPDHPLFGLSMPDAVAKQLTMLGEEATSRQIAAALQKNGYQIQKEDPEGAVHQGLRRRAKRQGDVLLVGRGKWGMLDWYSPDLLQTKLSDLGENPGRDYEYHRERVLAAQQAARQKGIKFGRETFEERYPYEKIEQFRKLRAAGTKLKDALAAIQMPNATYRKYKPAIDDEKGFGTQESFISEARRIRKSWVY